jgi:hypothetical protein
MIHVICGVTRSDFILIGQKLKIGYASLKNFQSENSPEELVAAIPV